MNRRLIASRGIVLMAVCLAALAATLTFETGVAARKAQAARGPTERPFKMSHSDVAVDWAISRDQEVACGGEMIAGGASSGTATFSHLGLSEIQASAAWDLGHLIDDPQFVPVGPAGGPVAPVLGPGDYPYQFHFDPYSGVCGSGPEATGEVNITAANGDEVHGAVQGGEAWRLDFVIPGDGVETFAIVAIEGGTGRFDDATGSFVFHTITRFDLSQGQFVIDLAEILPGGTIGY